MSDVGLSRVGMEIYTTAPVEEETPDTDAEEMASSDVDSTSNFTLQTGEIQQIDYIGEFFSDSFEQDYTAISANANISVPIEFLKYFFKGRRVCLKKGIQTTDDFDWEEMGTALLGFVTEITYNRDKVDIRLSGMDKLLDEEAQFEFTQTKRSEVVKQIIEASGLKAKVDPTGLIDDVIDFSTGSSSDDDGGEVGSTGSATIDEAVKSAIKGKKDALEKAKAIDKAFKNHVYYSYYYDCHHSNIESAWNNAHLNCADGANVLCAMFIAGGLKAVIVHVPSHYIVKLTIGGKTYYTDNAAVDGAHTTRAFGEVWRGVTSGSEVGTKIPM